MSSTFYYPTTTGSLADRRRFGNSSSSMGQETLSRFPSEYFGAIEESKVDSAASTSTGPIVLVVEDDDW